MAGSSLRPCYGSVVFATSYRTPVGDEDELRARIEAQVASRRADATPPRRERKSKPDGPDDAEQPPSEAVEVAPAETIADELGPMPKAPKRRHRTVRTLTRVVVVIAIAAVAAVLLRTYVAQSYYIPSASMEPTLHGCRGCNNDHVLVDKLSYRMHDIRRGDVVVFHRPKSWSVSDKVLIKRVIGVPGDTLTNRNGTVYVNGLALEEPYLNSACKGGTTNFPVQSVTVPVGQAFVMGDNRCDSSDSRRFGAIPDSAVVGRASVIIWPLGRIHWL